MKKPPPKKKKKLPFWVLRLSNVHVSVLIQALETWMPDATQGERDEAEHLHKALTTTREKRLARIKDPLA